MTSFNPVSFAVSQETLSWRQNPQFMIQSHTRRWWIPQFVSSHSTFRTHLIGYLITTIPNSPVLWDKQLFHRKYKGLIWECNSLHTDKWIHSKAHSHPERSPAGLPTEYDAICTASPPASPHIGRRIARNQDRARAAQQLSRVQTT